MTASEKKGGGGERFLCRGLKEGRSGRSTKKRGKRKKEKVYSIVERKNCRFRAKGEMAARRREGKEEGVQPHFRKKRKGV